MKTVFLQVIDSTPEELRHISDKLSRLVPEYKFVLHSKELRSMTKEETKIFLKNLSNWEDNQNE